MSLPYDYYPAVLLAIDEISKGRTLTAACDIANISYSTFRNYIDRDPVLKGAFADAEQRGHDAMAEALMAPDNHALYGHSNPQMAKVQSDNIKWFLSKKRPKEYGERVQVDHSVTIDVVITGALNRARQRSRAIEAQDDVVEADFVDLSAEDEQAMRDLLS